MFVMSLWAMIAATIVITSKTSDQILIGRVLNCTFSLNGEYLSKQLTYHRHLHRNGAGK
jgi:hypothetical protein